VRLGLRVDRLVVEAPPAAQQRGDAGDDLIEKVRDFLVGRRVDLDETGAVRSVGLLICLCWSFGAEAGTARRCPITKRLSTPRAGS